MNVRYFAAARAAAGQDEEQFDLPHGATVDSLLAAMTAADRPEPPAGTPPLARVLARCSFLLNEVAVRDRTTLLGPEDVLDVLPPFAGG